MNLSSPASPAPDAARLFRGSCVALISTSVAFVTVSAIMFELTREFGLSVGTVGWIGGAAIWGFALSQVVFAPLADKWGMRTLLRMAFVGHILGTLVMISAVWFAGAPTLPLFVGALFLAMANGLVEAACNPLVAALYPDDKTVRLNRFHVWFPGGIVLGGLAAYGIDQLGVFDQTWHVKLALILVPTFVYGHLLWREPFPATEGVRSGISMGEMFKATFTSPLMWVLLVAMAMTASVELGPGRWIPAFLEAGGMEGILVLVWINGLMAVLRSTAGTFVRRLSPTGVLLASAALSGLGLLALSRFTDTFAVFFAATVFAFGVCYFWPTMLGVVSERVPRSGALGLGLMGTVGMAVVGLVTTPQMGRVSDQVGHDELPVVETASLLGEVETVFAGRANADPAVAAADGVLDEYRSSGELPPVETAQALRVVINVGGTATGDDAGSLVELSDRAGALLGPAEAVGGRAAFLFLLPLCGALVLIFGGLYLRDRAAGGYRREKLEAA